MTTWDERLDAVWNDDGLTDEERIVRIDALATERPGDARALFERAGARDSAGLETEAEPLYRQALDLGLVPPWLTLGEETAAATREHAEQTEDDGAAALYTMRQRQYGLVLSDLKMLPMSGLWRMLNWLMPSRGGW